MSLVTSACHPYVALPQPQISSCFFSYDGLGNLLTADDGTGVRTAYSYSPASEVQAVTSSLNDSTHPGALVSSVNNGPFGPTSIQYGNGTVETPGYGYAGDLKSTSLTKNGTGVYNFGLGKAGPYVLNSTDTVNGSWTYSYDAMNRLANSANSTSGQSFTYEYDRWAIAGTRTHPRVVRHRS